MRLPRRHGRAPVALIVTPRFLPFLGGQERECALLAAEFRRRGFEPVVITEQLGLDTPLREQTSDGLIIRIPSSFERTLFVQLRVAAGMAVHVLRHRRSAAFAVVRTATVPGVLVGLLKALRLIRFPTLITAEEEHDIEALAHRPLFGVMRRLVSSHDVLNGLGRSNVEHLRRYGFPGSKITLIPNGIDTGAWETTTAPDRIERFLFLGRIDVTKGVFELVDAFAEVHGRHPAVRLVIAGEGPALPALQARAAELGVESAITFAGRVEYERLGDLFDSIDCLVLPSYSEGMPLSVLEAASHHRPLIVTDVGDLRATFGESVRLCRPRDTAALAEALEAAVSDPSPSADYDEVIERVAIGAVAGEMLRRLGAGQSRAEEISASRSL